MATIRVDQTASGEAGNGRSSRTVFSPDGRKILFASTSTNLVSGDTNLAQDLFVKDLETGTITRVSTSSDGVQANGRSNFGQFSPNGNQVLFTSEASNLVAGDTNDPTKNLDVIRSEDVFVKDLTTNTTIRVSTAADGTEANATSGFNGARFSPDGRNVAFESLATNLVPNETNRETDIFVKTISGPNAGAISRVSTASNGAPSNGGNFDPQFSLTGSKILFTSLSTNLVSNDTNAKDDVFAKDLSTGTVTRVSVGSRGEQANGVSYAGAFSPDGSKALFVSRATNLTGDADNGAYSNVFLKDLITGDLSLISSNSGKSQAGVENTKPLFSPDGSKVAFSSQGNDASPYAIGSFTIKDLRTGVLTEINPSISAPGRNAATYLTSFSPDGSKFALTNVRYTEEFGFRTNDYITDEVPCYATGTLIRTPHGPVPVESLDIGSEVMTASGETRPIIWIGHREIDCTRHPRPEAVWPVQVRAQAFGSGLPSRDLWLSPDHAVCVTVMDEVLIPIKHLINGATVQQGARDTVTYWHVELDAHDILLANDLPAESFLDTGMRACFANGAEHAVLHPDFTPLTLDDFCRPLIQGGPIVDAVHQRLVARALSLGWTTTAEADLGLTVDGMRLTPEMDGPVAVFELPLQAREVRITSRRFVPEHTNMTCRDGRTLGVPVRRIGFVDGAGVIHTIPIDSDLLRDGFHFLEGTATDPWRWTNGNALLPPALWAGYQGIVQLRIATAPDRGTLRAWQLPSGGSQGQGEGEAEPDKRSA